MPYQASSTQPGERANKLGHLDVLKSPLVNRICRSFYQAQASDDPQPSGWAPLPSGGEHVGNLPNSGLARPGIASWHDHVRH